MKIFIIIPLLYCLLGFSKIEKPETSTQLNGLIKGKWTNAQIQVQYIVDSHLVHEAEITDEKGKIYDFNATTVQVTYPDGTSAQGTYSVFVEDEKKKVTIQLRGTTTTYTLLALTPTSMTWQTDLEDTSYSEGLTRKSAERAIYTEVFKR